MADDKFVLGIEVDASTADAVINKITGSLRELNQAGKLSDKELQRMEKNLGKMGTGAEKASKGTEKMAQSLSTTRYALYDLSGTLTTAGLAMTGFAAAVFGAGIAWERDFANVLRTSGIQDPLGEGADAAAHLRDQFVELNQTLPVTSSELAEIGALGGQLGIEADGIQDFTRVVAQLTATTDLSAEAAGTALGRFKALMGVGEGEFENLASSILKVGVNSVATESQIANTATQLSSMGTFAGLTADEVVGLSGALASVGTQPELARGTVTRLFTRMSAAVSEGGDRLEEFGRVSGMSGKQFAATWGKEGFGDTLQAFIKGLGKEGGDAVETLNKLGINSVRDVPALLRLADAQEVVNDAFSDAKSGYEDATELADQYRIIQETVAAKVQLLANNFQQFLVALADGGTVFGGLLDGLTDILKVLTQWADTPFIGDLMQWGVIITGLVGVLALLGSGLARSAASAIALAQAYAGLTATTTTAASAQGGLAASLGLSAGAARTASIAVGALRAGLAGLVTLGVGTLFVELSKGADTALNAIRGWGNETEEIIDRLSKKGENFWTDLAGNSGNTPLQQQSGLDDFALWLDQIAGVFSTNTQKQIRELEDSFKSLAESGSITQLGDLLEETARRGGVSMEELMRLMPGLQGTLEDAGYSMEVLADGTVQFTDSEGNIVSATDAATGGLSAMEQAARDAAAAVDEARRAFDEFNQSAIAQENAQIGYEQALSRVAEAAGVAGASLNGTNKQSLDLRSSAAAAAGSIMDYTKALIENGYSADEARDAYDDMRARLIDSLVAQGQSREEAEKWANKVMGSADSAKDAIDDYAWAVQRAKDKGNITTNVKVTGVEGAQAGIDKFIRTNDGRRIKIHVTATGGESFRVGNKWVDPGYATGGYVRGPGGPTSDSIRAWLSNGEYVVKASAVKKFGVDALNAINAGRAPKFAAGGLVGGGAGAGQSVVGSGIMELGPKSLGRLGGGGNVTVVLDDQAIARAANRGNAKLNKFGAR